MNIKDNFDTKTFRFINYVNLTEEQSRKVWEGRNHPEVRKWMVNAEPFSYDVHEAFIEGLKERKDRLYWAVLSKGELVGSFSLHPYDSEKKEGEMGKYLFYEFRGKGLGKLSTQEFIDAIFSIGLVNRVYIKTLISNTTNQHVNESAGFVKYATDDKYVYMELIK
jgi:RimJ/RimL family protein N-acetyltransferase